MVWKYAQRSLMRLYFAGSVGRDVIVGYLSMGRRAMRTFAFTGTMIPDTSGLLVWSENGKSGR